MIEEYTCEGMHIEKGVKQVRNKKTDIIKSVPRTVKLNTFKN